MRFEKAFIPLGLAWSTPFAKWQGPLAELSSLDMAEDVTRRALADRQVDPAELTEWALGHDGARSRPRSSASRCWPASSAPGAAGGPWIARACATSAAVVEHLATQVELGAHRATIGVLTDRTSNGPLMLYPSQRTPGGCAGRRALGQRPDEARPDHRPVHERHRREHRRRRAASRARELDELTLLRYEQYRASLADDRAFQRRYQVPVTVPGPRSKPPTVVEEDWGVFPTTAEGLARLTPVKPGGVVTYGAQTHPADGAAGVVVTDADRAAALGRDGGAVADPGHRVRPRRRRPSCPRRRCRPPSAPCGTRA